jgi:hypothetical protein
MMYAWVWRAAHILGAEGPITAAEAGVAVSWNVVDAVIRYY